MSMKPIPRVRCPVCGHMVFLRNVAPGLFHKLGAYIHTVTSGGRGKIKNHYVEQPLPEGFEDFWIRRLESVIAWLKKLKQNQKQLSLSMPVTQVALQSQVSPALVKSVSPVMALSLKSPKMQTQSVPKGLQMKSLDQGQTLSLNFHPELSLKTKMSL